MSFLFTIENKAVKPNIETLLISPFKDIWERDDSSGKFIASNEFAYIEFMSSVKKTNPYKGYGIEERQARLNKDIMGDVNYTPDELIIQGINWLIEHQKTGSMTYNYYMSARAAAEKMQDFFNTFNMNAVNFKTGNPLYKPKEITSSLIDTSKVLENLISLEEKVNNEVFESAKNKGQKIVSTFANPSTL